MLSAQRNGGVSWQTFEAKIDRFGEILATYAMSRPPNYEVLADLDRNLIELRFRGNLSPADMGACLRNISGVLPELRPGFTVVTDLSELESMSLECAPDLTKAMDAFRARGVATVVRIIPDPTKDIGFNILAIIPYRRGIHVITCKTRAEADRVIR